MMSSYNGRDAASSLPSTPARPRAGVEFVGEVTVNILGLNESKYQWVIDALEDEKRQKAQKELEESQRRMLRAQERERKAAQQAQELEEAS